MSGPLWFIAGLLSGGIVWEIAGWLAEPWMDREGQQ